MHQNFETSGYQGNYTLIWNGLIDRIKAMQLQTLGQNGIAI